MKTCNRAFMALFLCLLSLAGLAGGRPLPVDDSAPTRYTLAQARAAIAMATASLPEPFAGLAADSLAQSLIPLRRLDTGGASTGWVIELVGGVPTWTALPSSLPPSGSAGGDLSGTYPNPSVAKIQGNAVLAGTPSDTQFYVWNSSNTRFEPVSMSSAATMTHGGAVTLSSTGVSPATYGDGTHVAQLSVGADGRLTVASNVTITGAAPTGSAGGDLSGTYPNPAVIAIRGHAVKNAVPTDAQVLVWVDANSDWEPVSLSGDFTISSAGVATLASSGVVAATYGDGTHVAQVTFDAKGRATSASSVAITGAAPTGAAGGDLTGSYPNPTLTTSGVTPATYGSATQVAQATFDAKGRATSVANVTISGVAPGGSAGGDLTGTYPNPTLAKWQGNTLSLGSPTAGHLPEWDGSNWSLHFKPIGFPARCASTANIPGTYSNGSLGVGATLTVTATGALLLDTVTTALGDTVVLKNQSTGSQNGVYTVTTAGATGVSAVLTRKYDFNQSGNIFCGYRVYVMEGLANGSTEWALETATVGSPVTVGTTALVFGQIAGYGLYEPGAGLSLSSGVFNLNTVTTQLGGTGTDLSATGGAHQFVKQSSLGASFSVGTIGMSDLGTGSASSSNFLRGDGTFNQVALASNVTGTLPAANGGTGATALGSTLAVSAGTLDVVDATATQNGGVKLATDLGGTAALPQVVGLQGVALPSLATGFLKYTGSAWTFTSSSATPAGSTTQVQWNSSGSFGADAGLTYGGVASTGDLLALAPTGTGSAVNAIAIHEPASFAGDGIHVFDSSSAALFRVANGTASTAVYSLSPTSQTSAAAFVAGLQGYQTSSGSTFGNFVAQVNAGGTAVNAGALNFIAAEVQSSGHLGTSLVVRVTKKATGTAYNAAEITSEGSFIQNGTVSALATGATDGFFYVGAGAGAPTGTPSAFTGNVATYADITNNLLWFNPSGSLWRPVGGNLTQIVSTASNVTLTNAAQVVFVSAAPYAHTITLPDATKWGGQSVVLKIEANAVTATIAATAGNVENNATFTATSSGLSAWTFTSDGANWWITGKF